VKTYLVDTSAWILSFSPKPSLKLKTFLSKALEEDRVSTCGVVLAELLQGCRHPKDQKMILGHFEILPYLEWKEKDWVLLGEKSALLRSKGLTLPLNDIMIILLAMRHNCTLLHRDCHFDLATAFFPLSVERA